MTNLPFADRREAGRVLGARVAELLGPGNAVVLGLPRGGLPVAAEVAKVLDAPLDVEVVRKLGMPWQPELAMGAVATGDVRVLNEDLRRSAGVSEDQLDAVTARERQEVLRREHLYRGDRPPARVAGARAVVVDDGVATGATAEAAVQAVRVRGAEAVVLAIPVGAPDTVARLRQAADELVCLATPPHFISVGQHYRDFAEIRDEEVRRILDAAQPS